MTLYQNLWYSTRMDLLIKNAQILPMTEEGLSFNGSIGVDYGKIVFIGKEPDFFKAKHVIDANRMLALPGLVNAHTHLSMTYFRNYQDVVTDLHDWLSKIWPIEDALSPQDVYHGSVVGIAEAIMSGTTCFTDMYFFAHETCKAAGEAKIKANIGLTLFGNLEQSRMRVDNTLVQLSESAAPYTSFITIDVAPHAVYTCPPETYLFARELKETLGCSLHTHACETKKEVADCRSVYGKTPIELLADLGCLDKRTYLAHCVHLSEHDIELLEQYKPAVVHNPSSNCKLASGIAPVARVLGTTGNVALGTDGASSNNNLDMFQEMRLCAMLSAVSTGNPRALTPYEILRMATLGGATALHRAQECGTLEVGKDADIILVDIDKPHLTPLNDPFSALVFSAKSSDVDTTICKGNILMQNRCLTTIDQEASMKQLKRNWKQLLDRTTTS